MIRNPGRCVWKHVPSLLHPLSVFLCGGVWSQEEKGREHFPKSFCFQFKPLLVVTQPKALYRFLLSMLKICDICPSVYSGIHINHVGSCHHNAKVLRGHQADAIHLLRCSERLLALCCAVSSMFWLVDVSRSFSVSQWDCFSPVQSWLWIKQAWLVSIKALMIQTLGDLSALCPWATHTLSLSSVSVVAVQVSLDQVAQGRWYLIPEFSWRSSLHWAYGSQMTI